MAHAESGGSGLGAPGEPNGRTVVCLSNHADLVQGDLSTAQGLDHRFLRREPGGQRRGPLAVAVPLLGGVHPPPEPVTKATRQLGDAVNLDDVHARLQHGAILGWRRLGALAGHARRDDRDGSAVHSLWPAGARPAPRMDTMLRRFERLMERAIEGSVRRVFPAGLQPVELARSAARAMEDAQVVGLHGPDVPNLYLLKIASADFERFADFRASLSRELGQYLADYARDRRFRPVGPPRVEVEEDASLRPGTVRVVARFVDLEPQRQARLEEALEGTRQLRLAPTWHPSTAASAAPRPTTWLEDGAARRHPLDEQAGLARVGRSIENDVVLDSPRVSRYHAHIRFERGAWYVYDLDSTNGTFVGDRRVGSESVALGPGDQLRLGDRVLTVRVERQSNA